MAKDVRLPQLGQTMEEGTIVNVLIKAGDKINKGDVIFEVETDKATLEMESPASGFVKNVLVAEGQTIPVNAPMLVVGDEHEEVSQSFLDSLGGAASAVKSSDEPKEEAKASEGVECPEAKVIRLPQLGQTMEEGTIVNILVKIGDEVKKGDVVFEVETDKATLEMECPGQGCVKGILVTEGQTIPVNAAVLVLADKDVDVPQGFIDSLAGAKAAVEVAEEKAPEPVAKPEAPKVEAKPAPAPAGKVFASPRAKMVAKELGVNIASLTAGNGVRIVEADVRKAAATGVATTESTLSDIPESKYKLGQTIPVSKMQKIVGQRMLQSKQNIPCFYLNTIVDMTEAVKFRGKLNKTSDVKISFNDFIIRAIGLAISKNWPVVSGQVDGNGIKLKDSVGVGLAISVDDGLVAPTVKNADSMGLVEVAKASKAIIEKAKSGKLSPDDLSGGCTTVSNLGGFGIDSFIPIVVPGQATIFGIGRISDTCVPMDGNIMIRKMMAMTLSVDHIVINGAEAAQFLACVKKYLENPESLL